MSNTNERTLGQLVSSATQDLSAIVRGEIALAKAELSTQAKTAGKGGGMLAVAGVLALFLLQFLLITLAWLLTSLLDWSPWMGFGVVTLLLLLIVGILAMIGIKNMKKVKPKPERAIADAQATVAALKGANPNTGAAIAGVITHEDANRLQAEKARDKARADAAKAEEKAAEAREEAQAKRQEAAEQARAVQSGPHADAANRTPEQPLTSSPEAGSRRVD